MKRHRSSSSLPKVPVALAIEIWEELSSGATLSELTTLLENRGLEARDARRIVERFDDRFQSHREGREAPSIDVIRDLVDPEDPRPLRGPRYTVHGLVAIGLGLLVGYGSVIQPLREAREGAETVTIGTTGIAVGIFATTAGAALLILGKQPSRDFRIHASVAVIVVSIGAYLAVMSYLDSLGYVRQW